MTYIEFFDKTAVENVCACLTSRPDRLILIGSKSKVLYEHAARYAAILKGRGCETEILCRGVNRNSLSSIVEELSRLVETYEDCAFDLTGGDELYLVATGMVCERYRDRNLQMHRFNIANNSIIDCDRDGVTIKEDTLPALTVEENVLIYGGRIVCYPEHGDGTYPWDLNPYFREDVDRMWDVCRRNPKQWNKQISVLEAAETCLADGGEANVTEVPTPQVVSRLAEEGNSLVNYPRIMGALQKSGLILEWVCNDSLLRVRYKNEQVKRCLTKAGQALEMKVLLVARSVCDKDGSRTYSDAVNGVFIDWDGELHHPDAAADTENEIDVMMMRGALPVFVSCKNGHVDMDELYKLDSVAERFGGKYARKVLVASGLDGDGSFEKYFRQRAEDMGIRAVCGVQSMTDEQLEREVRQFWNNNIN